MWLGTPYLIACGTALLAGCSSGPSGGGKPSAAPIPLAEVRARGIAGTLGVPLGRIVRVEGVAVDGRTLRLRAADGKTFVQVGVVDGRRFVAPVLIELSIHWLVEETLKKPSHGQAVRLVGWETGRYAGIVEGEFDQLPAYAGTDYAFLTSFVVAKSE